MGTLGYLLLSVRNPRDSAKLYTQILGCEPVEDHETFVLYVLRSGLKVGLWIASEIEPRPAPPGGVELTFTEPSREALLRTYEAWKALGMPVLQEPTEMDFGFTFVVEDPDGHRLRPFVRADSPR